MKVFHYNLLLNVLGLILMSAEEYLDEYVCNNVGPFEDKFSKESIKELLDDGNIKYSEDELDDLLQFVLDMQKQIDDDGRRNLKSDLEEQIEDVIENTYNIENLSNEDIIKVLIKVAYNYSDYSDY